MKNKKIAVVTGSNRGLGLGAVKTLAKKGYKVFLTARDSAKGEKEAKALQVEGFDVEFLSLDTASEKSIEFFAAVLAKKTDHIDVLINNAGVFLDSRDGGGASALHTKGSTLVDTLQTNTVGPFLLSQKLIPLLQKSSAGRIVNVSSGMGQLSEMNAGYAAYRISKTALNAVTKILAEELKGSNILVNSVCPGWVKTDMGGPGAERNLEEGVASILFAATLPAGGPTGGYFRDGKPLQW